MNELFIDLSNVRLSGTAKVLSENNYMMEKHRCIHFRKGGAIVCQEKRNTAL